MVGSGASDAENTNETMNASRETHKDKAKLDSACQEEEFYDSECWNDAKELLHSDIDDNANEHREAVDQSSLSNEVIKVDSSGCSSLLSKVNDVLNGNDDDLLLHKAVFEGNNKKVIEILKDVELVSQRNLLEVRDKHGNTALHLACMLGRPKEVVSAFLDYNADCILHLKNLSRWTPFHEACSYGNRDIITLFTRKLEDEVESALSNSKLSDFLERTKNYRLVLKWEFQSWVPFVSRVLPSDVCVINKQGKFIRIDTRLLDFDSLFKKRNDSCLIYSNRKWIIVNSKTKKYQYFESPHVYKSIEDRVDEFMSTDIMDLELKSSGIQLTRSTSGWIWKEDKVSKVGRFKADLYEFTNVFLVTRKRREHLSEEDLKRNKTAYRSAVHMFKFGERAKEEAENPVEGEGDSNDDNSQDSEDTVVHRASLPAPEKPNVTWDQYINSEPGNQPNLGREQRCKTIKTAVTASVAMSEEFPLAKKEFLDLLSVVPLKMFKKLKEFVEMKLPDGFPVRLDLPVFPFLTARITFEDFCFVEGPIDESLFAVPDDFEKATNLLPSPLRDSGGGKSGSS